MKKPTDEFTLRKILEFHYDRFSFMCRRYPRSAKKKRVRKKWANRFPDSLRLRMLKASAFWTAIAEKSNMAKEREYSYEVQTTLET
jgi:hypothetical protein